MQIANAEGLEVNEVHDPLMILFCLFPWNLFIYVCVSVDVP